MIANYLLLLLNSYYIFNNMNYEYKIYNFNFRNIISIPFYRTHESIDYSYAITDNVLLFKGYEITDVGIC